MSENPYQSTPEFASPSGVAPQQKPGGLTTIAVICLILGVLGVLGSIFAIAMAFLQGSINELQNVQAGGPGAEIQAKMQELQLSQFVPTLIFAGCNVIIGSLLAIGAIGVLGLKEAGRNLLRNALLAAAIFIIVRGLYHVWAQFGVMSALAEVVPQGGGDAATFQSAMQVGMIIGLVFSLAILAVFVGFYLWSRMYLNKPSIRALFGAAN